MPVNWHEVVSENVHDIVAVAASVAPKDEIVCILFDIDDVQSGNASIGLQQVIAHTKLQGGVPISISEGNRLVCVPINASNLLSFLEGIEDTTNLKRAIVSSSPNMIWVVCFDGDQRICLDVHVRRPEFN